MGSDLLYDTSHYGDLVQTILAFDPRRAVLASSRPRRNLADIQFRRRLHGISTPAASPRPRPRKRDRAAKIIEKRLSELGARRYPSRHGAEADFVDVATEAGLEAVSAPLSGEALTRDAVVTTLWRRGR